MKDKDTKDTLYARAQVDLEAELGGRFAKPRPLVSGQVPEQPATSPWARDPVGQEPPLGFDVNEVQPVGETYEIERSIAALEAEKTETETSDGDDQENHAGPERPEDDDHVGLQRRVDAKTSRRSTKHGAHGD